MKRLMAALRRVPFDWWLIGALMLWIALNWTLWPVPVPWYGTDADW